MGYASYLVYKAGGGPVPLTLYGIQLALNLAWSPLFFKVKEIGYAVADITGTVSSALICNTCRDKKKCINGHCQVYAVMHA